MQEFKPPTDPALHALWVIRNWTRPLERGTVSMLSPEHQRERVHQLASEVFEQLSKRGHNESP